MSDPNYTALLIILDRSGSMAAIRDEMVGAVHRLLREQSRRPGFKTVDVVQFDHQVIRTHQLEDPARVELDIEPRGGTALYDAVGAALHDFRLFFNRQPEHARPARVQIVVVTDGADNASVEHSPASVRGLIEASEAAGWEFIFTAATIDPAELAKELGTRRADTVAFEATAGSVRRALAETSRRMATTRRSASPAAS